MLFAECHQSLSRNVSKQSAGDRANSHWCSSGNKHICTEVYVTRNVFRGYVVLFALHYPRVQPNGTPVRRLVPSWMQVFAYGSVCESPWPLLHMQMLLAKFNQSWSWNEIWCTKSSNNSISEAEHWWILKNKWMCIKYCVMFLPRDALQCKARYCDCMP